MQVPTAPRCHHSSWEMPSPPPERLASASDFAGLSGCQGNGRWWGQHVGWVSSPPPGGDESAETWVRDSDRAVGAVLLLAPPWSHLVSSPLGISFLFCKMGSATR